MESRFRFTAGPWNVNEGVEAFGPGVRPEVPIEEKFKKFAEIGLSGVQFHDDDAVLLAKLLDLRHDGAADNRLRKGYEIHPG